MEHLASHLNLTQDNQINSESSKIDMGETRPKAMDKQDLHEQNRLGILEAE